MSRTIKFTQAGGPEVLEFIEMQVPAPGPHEVRIAVKAIGINRAESMWRNDKYIEPVKFPAGLGYEAAGIVDAVGKDVTDFAVGDAVSTIPAFSLNQYFTYGEVILAPEHAVVKHPEWLSFVEAASVWMMTTLLAPQQSFVSAVTAVPVGWTSGLTRGRKILPHPCHITVRYLILRSAHTLACDEPGDKA
jgi:NADPH:quinone reductase-like Zn-dependent oxidoreductase